ncbi:hypothetical protein [Mycolicibacterium vinylchloridicum]|uniref:hypothetical protein n=1 Tax=Mycolicibacterium vinylchloridicum TaxID=2736928 RepID=UPI00022E7279|nr:hypothetical protein [Mycolicibacterium vinylchloridicum]EHB55856.1 hypothetical protein MycrhDRAFT_3050 [Mycolicibacterium rhodesiae JS60]
MRIRRMGLAVLAATVVLAGGGCAKAITGTPVATPGEAGKGMVPADLLTTTCREYLTMDTVTRREVIAEIGKSGNQLVAMNPQLWAGVAAALCGFVDPSAPVKDVVMGQGIR